MNKLEKITIALRAGACQCCELTPNAAIRYFATLYFVR